MIGNIHIPILILHAKDDHVVPFILGQKLFNVARETRKNDSKPLFFVPFEAENGYAHVNIHLAPELPQMVKTFFDKSAESSWKSTDYNNELMIDL